MHLILLFSYKMRLKNGESCFDLWFASSFGTLDIFFPILLEINFDVQIGIFFVKKNLNSLQRILHILIFISIIVANLDKFSLSLFRFEKRSVSVESNNCSKGFGKIIEGRPFSPISKPKESNFQPWSKVMAFEILDWSILPICRWGCTYWPGIHQGSQSVCACVGSVSLWSRRPRCAWTHISVYTV